MTTNRSTIPGVVFFLSWRDIKHPRHGGAEVYTHQVCERLVRNGLTVWHFSASFEGSAREEIIDGVRYIRRGNPISVIPRAIRFYRKHRDQISLVVEQCNTHRFFGPLWAPPERRIFFVHHLTRTQWFELWPTAPAAAGYAVEVFALWLNRKDHTITPSPSTRKDLERIRYRRVMETPQGIDIAIRDPSEFAEKEPETFIYAGRVNPYKGVHHVIEAVGMLRRKRPGARLWVVGRYTDETFHEYLEPAMAAHGLDATFGEDDGGGAVHFFGFVSTEQMHDLMGRAVALLMASSREGWGLTITECAALGTPSIVWPAPGVVDAVDFGRAGYLCTARTLPCMVAGMERALDDAESYARVRKAAHEYSKGFTPDRAAEAFQSCLERVWENACASQ